MMLKMSLCGLSVVVRRLPMMSVRKVSMVGSLFVMPVLMMLRCFMMVLGCMFMMFGCMGVMLSCFLRV
jgi:hypothetical protein